MLLAKSDMVSFVDSLVGPLALINALIVTVAIKKKDEVANTLLNLETIWDEYGVYEKVEDKTDDDVMFDAVVVGGGAAGMMAAITAAERGKHVLLLEKNAQLGAEDPHYGQGPLQRNEQLRAAHGD